MATFNMFPPGLYSSSQESDLGDEELSKMVLESEPATTKKSTRWGFKKFEHWMEKRSISIEGLGGRAVPQYKCVCVCVCVGGGGGGGRGRGRGRGPQFFWLLK